VTAIFNGRCRSLFRSLLLTSLMAPAYAAQLPFNQFVVFGDSVSDTGNINSGGPPYYTASAFTDGPDTTPATQIQGVWHQQLAQDLGITSATASMAGGTNFAYYAAVTNGTDPTYLSLQTQVNQYLSRGSANANSLYLFWGGANDITNLAPSTNVSQYQSAAQTAVQNIESQITQLYNSGGRNFLWVNLPSFDKVPSGLTSPPAVQAGLAAGSQTYDTDWTAAIAQLKQQFPQITITSVDAYSLFNSMEANPSQYGLTNVTQNAYSVYASGNQTVNPDQFLFWYQDHMTTAADAIITGVAAQDVDATYANLGTSAAPEPESLALLGLGVALLGLLRLRKAR
jgi:outer membrane lipase/esterase